MLDMGLSHMTMTQQIPLLGNSHTPISASVQQTGGCLTLRLPVHALYSKPFPIGCRFFNRYDHQANYLQLIILRAMIASRCVAQLVFKCMARTVSYLRTQSCVIAYVWNNSAWVRLALDSFSSHSMCIRAY